MVLRYRRVARRGRYDSTRGGAGRNPLGHAIRVVNLAPRVRALLIGAMELAGKLGLEIDPRDCLLEALLVKSRA